VSEAGHDAAGGAARLADGVPRRRRAQLRIGQRLRCDLAQRRRRPVLKPVRRGAAQQPCARTPLFAGRRPGPQKGPAAQAAQAGIGFAAPGNMRHRARKAGAAGSRQTTRWQRADARSQNVPAGAAAALRRGAALPPSAARSSGVKRACASPGPRAQLSVAQANTCAAACAAAGITERAGCHAGNKLRRAGREGAGGRPVLMSACTMSSMASDSSQASSRNTASPVAPACSAHQPSGSKIRQCLPSRAVQQEMRCGGPGMPGSPRAPGAGPS